LTLSEQTLKLPPLLHSLIHNTRQQRRARRSRRKTVYVLQGRSAGARATQNIVLRLKSSKKTYADSTPRQLRFRDHSHRYWCMGDGGRRLGVLLGTLFGKVDEARRLVWAMSAQCTVTPCGGQCPAHPAPCLLVCYYGGRTFFLLPPIPSN
jgi:hypothetical protein